MKRIDSDALGMLNKALGITGNGSQFTELVDGIVEQNLDVTPIIRRGRTQTDTGGIYTAFLRNIHASGNSVTSVVPPYDLGASRAPFPGPPMPPQFDIWLFNAWVVQLSGSGTLSAVLSLILPASRTGFSSTGGGLAQTMPLAFWDALATEGVEFGLLNGTRGPMASINIRIPRGPGTDLQFASTSSAAATFDCFMTIGVFPAGLGQDCVVG